MAYNDSVGLVPTARRAGQLYDASVCQSVVNASGAVLYPGRVLIKTALVSDDISVKHPVAADFTAKNITSVIANWSSGETVTAVISFRGTNIPVGPVAFDTDNNTSVTALKTAINTALDARYTAAQSAVATDTTGTLLLTVELAGEDIDMDLAYNGNITATKVVAGTTLKSLFVGVLADNGAIEINSSGTLVLQDGRGAQAAHRGRVDAVMLAAAAVSQGDALYISTDSGGTPGGLTASAGASRVWMDPSVIKWGNAPATATMDPRGAVAPVDLNT